MYLPAGFVLKNQGSTKARLILDPSGNLNAALLKAPNLEEKIGSVLRRFQNMPILLSADVREAFFKIKVAPASCHLSLFLMDYDRRTNQLTAKVTENSEMVTIQALVLIKGVNQSPAYLSIAFQDIAKGLEDDQLKWFLQFLRYLDDLQIGISARELMEFQEKADLEDPDLARSCQDPDCCPFVGDLSPPVRMCWWS